MLGYLIAVDDKGPGIPEEVAEFIFKKFPREKRSGQAGLGLYFCRMVAEHWGGEIGYSLLSEGGTRFWIRLPRVTA